MRNLIVLLSLALVIFLAGCVSQPKSAVSKGVIIKSFGPDAPEIYAGDSAVVTLEVENVGGEDARNVMASLGGLGLDWTWTKTPVRVAGVLERSRPAQGLPGGVADVQWDIKSPSNAKTAVYPITVRITYGYGTTATGSLKVYNNDYLRSLPVAEAQKIRESSGIESFSTSIAPLSITLSGAARPFIITGANREGVVSFQISNTEDGAPYMSKPGDFKIQINKAKVYNTDCTRDWERIVRIPRTGTKSLSCTFTLPSQGEVPTYTTIPVEIEIMYNYYIDGESKIKVLESPA